MGAISTIVKNLASESAPTFGKFVEEQPGLFSKLADVVRGTNFGKMDSRQLNKTLLNKGVTVDEVGDTLGGLSGTVSKDQVLDRIGERGIRVEDKILGEGIKPDGETFGKLREVVKRNDNLGYDNPRDAAMDLATGRLLPHQIDWINPDDYDITASLVEGIKDQYRLRTHYDTWVAPGAKEGSYREMFVTAPSKYKDARYTQFDDGIKQIDNMMLPTRDRITSQQVLQERVGLTDAEVINHLAGDTKGSWKDGHSHYDNIQNPIVRIRFNDRELPEGKKILFVEEIQGPQGDQKYQVLQKTPASAGRSEAVQKMFTDVGLSNDTVTRKHIFDTKEEALLFTKKNGIDSSLVQKVIEGEQGKMPPALQERIYDIGVKRILAYAKENGYDGVAWTPGKMQADRYSLAKHVDQLTVSKMGDNLWDIYGSKNGKDVMQYSAHSEKELADLIGKDRVAKVFKDLSKDFPSDTIPYSQFSGLDLEIGGEGLKSLYDVRIPSLFKKYGKGELQTLDLKGSEFATSSSIVNGLRKAAGPFIGDKSSVYADLHNMADFIEKGGIPKEAKLKFSHDAKSIELYEMVKDKAFSEKMEVPFIPITPQTPSRYPIYGLAPLAALGLGANQFGPQYFQNRQTAAPRREVGI
jgi:hypothetical protein